MKLKIKLVAVVLLVFAICPLAWSEQNSEEAGFVDEDVCEVWADQAKAIVESYELYKDVGDDFHSFFQESYDLSDFEQGSAGRILLTEAADGAISGLSKEQVAQNTIERCRQIDPEWSALENAEIAIPADVGGSQK